MLGRECVRVLGGVNSSAALVTEVFESTVTIMEVAIKHNVDCIMLRHWAGVNSISAVSSGLICVQSLLHRLHLDDPDFLCVQRRLCWHCDGGGCVCRGRHGELQHLGSRERCERAKRDGCACFALGVSRECDELQRDPLTVLPLRGHQCGHGLQQHFTRAVPPTQYAACRQYWRRACGRVEGHCGDLLTLGCHDNRYLHGQPHRPHIGKKTEIRSVRDKK